MKRLALLLVAAFCLAATAWPQTNMQVSLNYSISDFDICQGVNGEFEITSLNGQAIYSEDLSQPMLPWMTVRVCLPNGRSYSSLQYSTQKTCLATGVTLAPVPVPVPTSEIGKPLPPRQSPAYVGTYPAENVRYTVTTNWDGYDIAYFQVCPFQYDARTGSLYFVHNVNLTIGLTGGMQHYTTAAEQNRVRQMVCNMVVNHNDVHTLPIQTLQQPPAEPPIDYLIVTCDSLVDAFRPLARWKKIKGVNSEIVTVEHIAQTYQGHDLPSKIKHCLYDYFGDAPSLSKYVLLGGDDIIVPVRYCYSEFISRYINANGDTIVNSYYEPNMPSDLFYSCFSGNFEWDGNNNGIFAELSDNINLNPSISLTRLPARSSENISNIIQKIINYERGNFNVRNKRILMGGKILWQYGIEDPSKSDSNLKGNCLFSDFIEPLWDCERDCLYDTFTNLENIGTMPFISNNLKNALTKGYYFADIITHGSETSWQTQNSPWFNPTFATSFTNSNYTIITSEACNTNAFEKQNDPSLSEAFIRDPHNGIIAYIGNSRLGWEYNNGRCTQGHFLQYEDSFYYELLSSNSLNNFGYLVASVKKDKAALTLYDYNPYRWIQHGLNPVGDPEMPIFIDNPKRFANVNISSSQRGNVSLQTGEENCNFCAFSNQDNGQTLYNCQKFLSSYNFCNIPNNTLICVTKPHFAPLVLNYHDFIQNQTFNDETIIIGNSIQIGSNVNILENSGPVIFLNGTTEIKTNEIVISGETKIETGAQLIISNI